RISSTLSRNDLREADRQHIRVTQYLRGNEDPWAIETGWHTGDGDDWLRRGGLKLFSDGALSPHTSHMSSPCPEPEPTPEIPAGAGADGVVPGGDALADGVHTYPGTVPDEILDSDPAEANYGIAQMSEDDLFENAKWATEAGISVAIHAIGDQANHHVLNVFERLRETTCAAEQRFDRPLRHRVEHAQFIRAEDLARFAELDVIASMQPRHCIS